MDPWRRINRYLSHHLTPAARQIFVINACAFIGIQAGLVIMPGVMGMIIQDWWALTPRLALKGLRVWQFLSYMFVHVSGLHILLNMMILWFFAPELEARWGTSRFWRFYLYTGVGAGLLTSAVWFVTGTNANPVIGASGALFGLLLAFWAYYPDRLAYLWGVVRVPIRYLVPGILIIEIITLNRADGISHLTHLAGSLAAFNYLRGYHRTPDIRRWRYR